jgi:dynein regulatory complex protein 1
MSNLICIFCKQNAFTAERNELLELQRKKWEEKMEGRRQKEIDHMKSREKRVEDYENSIHDIRVKDSEEYNDIKISMETNVQVKSPWKQIYM